MLRYYNFFKHDKKSKTKKYFLYIKSNKNPNPTRIKHQKTIKNPFKTDTNPRANTRMSRESVQNRIDNNKKTAKKTTHRAEKKGPLKGWRQITNG